MVGKLDFLIDQQSRYYKIPNMAKLASFKVKSKCAQVSKNGLAKLFLKFFLAKVL